ncbi:XRE family transcriptional regulator [Streptococcus agalactiae]|uniref:XRE family transcriptional regulator n=1 Tax=Streptococcus agalactiae TaxID=1311 RepID=UPI001374C7E4|nr:XRE family transcriptional regulator [Streptococcus agalactiae]KAF1125754.1 XRE family transcriptional regulator [Streptococcus agalactiae]MCD0021647.1 helix-turn-helix transcriptional regulator [Streptococcus agalactiae]HEN7824089.1 helix-turn-helix transcriptional regulator [Streptococcus agalactiae]HEN9347519.1 helix-turn-helix transcriptional regulator [Streptococcus agalactiae]HEO2002317.1 helix-turn-helix transcriptional regulator [Streptococcus agalactiae]
MIGQKIKYLRRQHHLTLDELAKKLNTNYPDTFNFNKGRLSKWENNKDEPRLSSIVILADFFGVTVDYFTDSQICIDEEPSKIVSDDVLKLDIELHSENHKNWVNYGNKLLDNQHVIDENTMFFSYNYYDHAASAGTGQYLSDIQVETIELPVDCDADFVIPVCGDSMEPKYHSGDYVFVKLSVELSDGDIGVFEYYGDAYIKQLLINNEGAFLHSLNNKYSDIQIDRDSDFRIIGKVVCSYREQ